MYVHISLYICPDEQLLHKTDNCRSSIALVIVLTTLYYVYTCTATTYLSYDITTTHYIGQIVIVAGYSLHRTEPKLR